MRTNVVKKANEIQWYHHHVDIITYGDSPMAYTHHGYTVVEIN